QLGNLCDPASICLALKLDGQHAIRPPTAPRQNAEAEATRKYTRAKTGSQRRQRADAGARAAQATTRRRGSNRRSLLFAPLPATPLPTPADEDHEALQA